MINEFCKLLTVNEDLKNKFALDLLENILKFSQIEDFIKLARTKINNLLEENKNSDFENLNIFNALNIELLKFEFEIIKELVEFSNELILEKNLSIENNYTGKTSEFEGIIQWINNEEDSLSLEDLKESLEDRARNN